MAPLRVSGSLGSRLIDGQWSVSFLWRSADPPTTLIISFSININNVFFAQVSRISIEAGDAILLTLC